MAMPIAASAHDNGYAHRHQSQNNTSQVVGGLAGAVIGGVLGSNLAGTGVQDEGTALGAVAGAVIGSQLAGGHSNQGYYNQGSYGHSQYGQGYYQQPQTYYSGQTYGQPVYPRWLL